MKDLKITQVQVDCRELDQEQINKVISVFVKNKISVCYTTANGVVNDYTYLRVYSNDNIRATFLRFDENFTTLTYDQFIYQFDKPKKSLKKRFKKLKDRIVSLEQKLSEKEAGISVREVVNNLPIAIKKGMRFKYVFSGKEYEVADDSRDVIELYALDYTGFLYVPLVDMKNEIKQGVLVLLPPTDKKESEPKKGDICKFWFDDETYYEIGRYEANVNKCKDALPHVNILTFTAFKNAKVISIDEALELFKKQLLNEN